MLKAGKYLALFLVSLTAIELSLFVVYAVGEKFFFDKLFLRKSNVHGYFVPGRDGLSDFGERGVDIRRLVTYEKSDRKILGVNTVPSDTFTVAVIGDSFVWGLGAREEETVSKRLEEKLNKKVKTKVLQLGFPGYSALDYLSRYTLARELYSPDFYVFVLVFNDALLSWDRIAGNDFDGIASGCQTAFPEDRLVYDAAQKGMEPDLNKSMSLVESSVDASWKSRSNLCVLDESLKRLPDENAVYFLAETGRQDYWSIFKTHLNNNNKQFYSSEDGKNIKDYAKYWLVDYTSELNVSRLESHPSKIAHEMYAEIIYRAITRMKNL